MLIHERAMIWAIIQWVVFLLTLPITFSLTLRLDVLTIILAVLLLSGLAYYAVYRLFLKKYSQTAKTPNLVAVPALLPDEEIPIKKEEDMVSFLMSSVRIFAYTERSVLSTLIDASSRRTLRRDDLVDEDAFNVLIDGTVESSLDNYLLSRVTAGMAVSSSMFLLDTLTQSKHKGSFRSKVVSEEATILSIPQRSFQSLAEQDAKAAAQIAQVILSRLQRVTLKTMETVLGIYDEITDKPLDCPFKLEEDRSTKELQAIAFRLILGQCQESHQLSTQVSIRFLKKGEILCRQGQGNIGIVLILQGALSSRDDVFQHCFLGVGPALLTHPWAIHTLKSDEASIVAVFSPPFLERVFERYPELYLGMARHIQPSGLATMIDLALDWKYLASGEVLYRKGQHLETVHTVLHGRIRSVLNADQTEEHGAGVSLNERDMLVDFDRGWTASSTVFAIRDTELAAMPMQLFKALSLSFFPPCSLHLSKRLLLQPTANNNNQKERERMIRTVAIMPIDPGQHQAAVLFSKRLQEQVLEGALLIDSSMVIDALGRQHAFSAFGELKLAQWLRSLEQNHRLLLFVADPVLSRWTRHCVKQADRVLLIAEASGNEQPGPFERAVLLTKAKVELVLLHEGVPCPSGLTRRWLAPRSLWISAHHHVLLNPAPQEKERPLTFMERYTDLISHFAPRTRRRPTLASLVVNASTDDYARLARYLLGRSVGLVLGGGGARGIAHLGIIQVRSLPFCFPVCLS